VIHVRFDEERGVSVVEVGDDSAADDGLPLLDGASSLEEVA
jgi:hypothetical protein